jgi:ketosteroid isomerase-like protein
MSRENVEVVGKLYDAFARGDIDSVLAQVDPEIEFDLSDRLPDEGIHRGRAPCRSIAGPRWKPTGARGPRPPW